PDPVSPDRRIHELSWRTLIRNLWSVKTATEALRFAMWPSIRPIHRDAVQQAESFAHPVGLDAALPNASSWPLTRDLLLAGASFCRISFAAHCRLVSSQYLIGGPMVGARRVSCMFMLAALFTPLFAAAPVGAQSWPTRSVKFILTLGPGSGADIGARLLADRLTKKWDQPIVVENRPGGDGILAINAFVSAQDDHILLFAPSS